MRQTLRFTTVIAALCCAYAAAAQTLPAGVQKITSVEGITEYAFPNGLHVLLFPEIPTEGDGQHYVPGGLAP